MTAEGCRDRRRRLWENLSTKPDVILVALPRHVTYLAGYAPSPFSYAFQNAGSILLLERSGECTLILDNVQRRLANAAHVDHFEEVAWYDGKRSAPSRIPAILERASELLQRRNPRLLGVDSALPPAVTGRCACVSLDDSLLALSRARDPDELEAIRISIRAIEAGYAAARERVRAGMKEMEVFTLVQKAAIESAGRPVHIYGDFVSGHRTESGGGDPSSRVLERGDLLLVDDSVVIDGYRGDLCATWTIDGEPTSDQKEIAAVCLEAMSAGEALLEPGAPCRAIDSAVRAVFKAAGLADRFRHHTGHGVGLGHPDPPYIVAESNEAFIVGDVITLEPGCYVPGVGGMRFEHNYLITGSGFERLSNHKLAF